MNLLQSKIFSVVVLGLASLFVGILPNCFGRQGRKQWPLLLSSLLCFGGGVLLSTALLHILPELRESIPEEYKQYVEIVFCLGFFILYMVDEIVHFFYGDTHEANIFHNHGHNNNERRRSSSAKYAYGTMESRHLLHRESSSQASYNPSFYRARSDSVLFCDQPPSQLCHVGHQEPCSAAPTANIGLLAALSVHALLEGLVVGLEGRSDKVLLLLGAISSHKLVVSFCLGMELTSNPLYKFRRHFVYILIFSLGSSGGILVGMFVTNIPTEIKNLMIPILQGLAGGTLLYVTVSEVLPRERARWHQQHEKRGAGLIQFFSVALGFGLMTVLTKYLDYDG
nr:zinc transporter ZIP1 [Leptinotarsa decemlineata]